MKKHQDVPILPFGIVGFYGSKFAYAKSKVYKRVPTYRPCINYGKPFYVSEAREKNWSDEHISLRLLHIVQELCVDACDYRKHPENVWLLTPSRTALRGCRKFGKNRILLADSTGKETNGPRTLLEILVLRRVFHRILDKEKYTFTSTSKPVDICVPVSMNIAMAEFMIKIPQT